MTLSCVWNSYLHLSVGLLFKYQLRKRRTHAWASLNLLNCCHGYMEPSSGPPQKGLVEQLAAHYHLKTQQL